MANNKKVIIDIVVKGYDGAVKGLKGIGKAGSTAFKSIGMAIKGAGIGILLSIVAALGEAFKKNQKIMDAFNTVVNMLGLAIKPVVDFVADLITGLVELGEKFNVFGSAEDSIYRTARAMTEARKQTELLAAAQDAIKEKYEQQEEVLRQIRDNEELSLAERIKANESLAELVAEQGRKELATVDKRIANQKLILGMDKDNVEEQKNLRELETMRLEINNRLTGQISEQKTNAVSLRREANALLVAQLAGEKTLRDIGYATALTQATTYGEKLGIIRDKRTADARYERDVAVTMLESKFSKFSDLNSAQTKEEIAGNKARAASAKDSLQSKLDAEKARHKEALKAAKNLTIDIGRLDSEMQVQQGKMESPYVSVANKAAAKYAELLTTQSKLQLELNAIDVKDNSDTIKKKVEAEEKGFLDVASKQKEYLAERIKIYSKYETTIKYNDSLSKAESRDRAEKARELESATVEKYSELLLANLDKTEEGKLAAARLGFNNRLKSERVNYDKSLDALAVSEEKKIGMLHSFDLLQEEQRKLFDATQKEEIKADREAKQREELDTLSEFHAQTREARESETLMDWESEDTLFNDRQEVLDEQRAIEVEKAKGNRELLNAVNRKYDALDIKNEKEVTKQKQEEYSRRANLKLSLVNAVGGLTKSLLAKTRAGQYAALAIEKASAIGQIWVNNSIANAKAIAASPLTGGLPFTAINTTIAGVQTATAVAEAAKGMAAINSAGKGGSTDSTPKTYKFAMGGIVPGSDYSGDRVAANLNSGEFVANQQQKDNLLMAVANGNSGISGGITEERVAEIAAQVLSSVPVVVSTYDITDSQKAVEVQERGFN